MRRDELANFLARHGAMISDRLGALKVEAIADTGYWFDVGRYWLRKDDAVVLFKNKGFNHAAAPDAFVSRRRVNKLIETPAFTHVATHVARIEKTFSYRKRLTGQDGLVAYFARFDYAEISDAAAAQMTESRERLRSMHAKTALFQRIAGSEPDAARD
jgi:hypothetical protein